MDSTDSTDHPGSASGKDLKVCLFYQPIEMLLMRLEIAENKSPLPSTKEFQILQHAMQISQLLVPIH